MKNNKILIIVLFVFCFTSIYGKQSEPILSKIISSEISSINGQANLSGYLKIGDTATFLQNPIFRSASIYTISSPELINLTGTTKFPGDSIPFSIVVNYPPTNLPFFPVEFEFELNILTNPTGDTTIHKTEFYLFFTPYNSIEAWDKFDFPEVKRNWLNPDIIADTTRIYINPSSIPVSNLEEIVRQENDTTKYDWEDNFRIIRINGLAYEILMKANPLDSVTYYSSFGDDINNDPSHAPLKTFTGIVKGRLTTTIENDLGQIVEIPLTGIRVELYDRDALGSDFFEGDYTDSNGEYSLYYRKNQMWEGDNVELYLKFLSHTHKAIYEIFSTNAINAYYNVMTYQWSAPENAGEMIRNYNLATSSFHGNSKPEAFRVTHWANNAYNYFDANDVNIGKELRLNINYWGWSSNYLFFGNAPWPFDNPTINLTSGDDDRETTTYHEFGHHAMYRLQDNNFTLPNGTDGFSHSWDEENTSKLAWVEGWADFVQMMLDAAYFSEDNEYGLDRNQNNNRDYYEYRDHYSHPHSDITNGFRSEYYFACALYDVWDGPNKGLPNMILDGNYMHGWNDSNQFPYGWKTLDDIEIGLSEICAPLQANDYPERIHEYYKDLLNLNSDSEVKAKISRAFRENLVQWNTDEYLWGWHNTSLAGDKIFVQEEYDENPSGIWGPYTDTYDVNYYNKVQVNVFSLSSTGLEPIIDNQHIGIWDTYSNIYRNSSLNLVTGNFSTYGQNRIYVNNGDLNLGINNNTTNLTEKDNSVICIRSHGVFNINSSSTLEVKSGASFVAESGSTIFIRGNGKLLFKSGSFVCIGSNVTIVLQDPGSIIEFETDVNMGLAPDILDFSIYQSCNTPPFIPFTGNGNIIYNCDDYVAYTHTDDFYVTQNTTWSGNSFVFKKNLIIEPGYSLTITNSCKMRFSMYSKLIVKPGAKLIVLNSSLSNNEICNNPWQGIEVWGNTAQHQWPDVNGVYMQGYVELNNATIENAICALDLWKPGDYTKTGGIVFADEKTKFNNNIRSVHALNYRNFNPNDPTKTMDYQAVFNDCSFAINGDFHNLYAFYKHIDLCLVNGVRFNGCDFSLSPDALAISDYNQAIAAYSSGFEVNAFCNSTQTPCPETEYDKCTFTGFRTAIYAANGSLNTNTFYVNRAEFNNNSIGIEVSNVWNPIIINSNFYLNNNQFSTEFCSYGIYLEKSTGFAIEENKFFKANGAPLADYFGIGSINCETIDDIYKNEFTGLSAGNYAYGKNFTGLTAVKGLTYSCNKNTGNWADFYITGNPDLHNQGIQFWQGTPTQPAGNTFTRDGANWHIYNEEVNPIIYHYCTTCPDEIPIKIGYVSLVRVNTANSCPSHYGGHSSRDVVMDTQQKLDREVEFAIASLNYDNVEILYNQLKDGGSTIEKEIEINSSTPDDMWSLRAELLGDSPHLSKEVLKLVADKTDVFTESVIFDILAANPDELRGEELLKYVAEKEIPLPDYMIDILRQVATGSTYKTVLQQEMARYSHDRVRSANDMIRSILNEDELDVIQLRNWLSNLGGIESDKQIIATYLQEGNFSAAFALANTLPQMYNLQQDELTEHDKYMGLLQLEQTLFNEGRKIDQLTQSEQDMVNEFALSSEGSAGAQARGILESFYGADFNDCKSLDGEESFKNTVVNPNLLGEAYGLSILAKPNPAKDWATFDYTLPRQESVAVLEITDANGRIVETMNLSGNQGQKLWDTRNIPSGSYIITIKVAGFLKSIKLIVSK